MRSLGGKPRNVLLALGWYDHRLLQGIATYASEHRWHLAAGGVPRHRRHGFARHAQRWRHHDHLERVGDIHPLRRTMQTKDPLKAGPEAERELFLDWMLTAQTFDTPAGWREMFEAEGYRGEYWWTILENDGMVGKAS